DAIEKIDETLFGQLRDGIDGVAIAADGEEHGGRRKVAVPEIVAYGLKMPKALAGVGVQGDQAISEEVIAHTVGGIKIGSSRTCRDINDAASHVDGHTGPVVGGTAGFPGALRPGVIAEFAGMGNGVKGPPELSSAYIERADVAGRGRQRFRIAAADNEHIFIDDRRSGKDDGLSRSRLATETFAQIDATVLTERGDRLAVGGIQGINKMQSANENAGIVAITPIGEPTIGLR